ncbi:ferric reductase-like transmembrane domain-containing protein [Microbacterium oryzae]|uniref:ferredoxin reductase family protein n=1 Tax=Microbacterium oryzae TaxID=743009 RepID=UPI0025B17A8A|nr:ferric reductase-like transmembrane domain-containing protein [Microbacterium oryzae]MDN3310699.1 ferric reductase-like transmembrane domain-containing protein [Microbacterium oryzae]
MTPWRRTRTVEALFTVAVIAGLILAVGTAVIGVPLPLAVIPTVAHVGGMVAGYAAAVTLILVSRAPLLDRAIGTDRLTRWHAITGASTMIATVVHAVAATVAFAELTGTGAAAIGGVLALPGLGVATIGTALILGAGVCSARAVRRRLRYETWHALHLLMYVGIALAFVHALAGPDLAGRPLHQVLWTLLYTVAFGLLLRYRLLEPLVTMWRQRMRVAQVIEEGPGVTTILVAGRNVDELRAEPGQFFRWRFLTRDTWLSTHPFSLSAPPTASSLRLTVKDAGDGTRLLRGIPVGTRVLAEGPYGGMTATRRSGHGVLLIAGGVGITPMRTLFETLPPDAGPVTLLYRASTLDDLVFRQELELIAHQRGADLRYIIGRSSHPATDLGAARLHQLVPDLTHRDVYLCASERLASSIRAALEDAGVPRRRVHEERFSF